MKKVRLLTIALASVFVCGMAAACGTPNTPTGNEGTENEGTENEGTENQEPAGGGPAVQKTPQEVWEEFAQLKEFSNVTILETGLTFAPALADSEGDGSDEPVSEERYDILKIDAANRRIFHDLDGVSDSVYAEIDGVPYMFSRSGEGDPWDKRTGGEGDKEYFSLSAAITFELGAFEDYTYDETTGKYVTTVVGKAPRGHYTDILDKEKWKDYFVKREVRIENGNLVEFYGEGNDGSWQRYVFSNYGTTTVTIPKEGSRLYEGDPHVTADMWAEKIKLPYINVTINMTVNYESDLYPMEMETEYLWDLENHRIKKTVSIELDSESFPFTSKEYFFQMGSGYVYIDDENTKTTDVGGEKYQQNTPQGFAEQELAALGAFEEYTYDENGEYYVSTAEKTVGERTYTKRTIQFEDGKIRMILLELSASEYGMSMTYEIIFSDYGKTAVEIPNF